MRIIIQEISETDEYRATTTEIAEFQLPITCFGSREELVRLRKKFEKLLGSIVKEK